VDQLLAELKEYAMEVDMDFVRRAVRAIGQVAIKIESATEKCVNTLLDLIATKVNYVVQEAIVVIKDIFRKYPGYEGIIPQLCQCIDDLDEPNARSSLIWIVGEYAEKITNAGDILEGFVESFNEEFTQTQLQILTAVVKLFLKKPEESQSLVQKVLQTATAENDNPDIRDRAYVYWRLLSSNSQVTKDVVLSVKPPITSTIQSLPPGLLDTLIGELSTLASVYHKPPESFLGQGRFGTEAMQKAAIEEQQENARDNPIAAAAAAAAASGGATSQGNLENLLDIDFDGAAPASLQGQTSSSTGMEDLVGGGPSGGVGGAPGATNTMDDLMGIFGGDPGASASAAPDADDLMNGFGGLSMDGGSQQASSGQKKTNVDILGLF